MNHNGTITTVLSGGIHFQEVGINDTSINIFAEESNTKGFLMASGELKIITSGHPHRSTVVQLLDHPQNKPMDIYLYSIMTEAQRKVICDVISLVPAAEVDYGKRRMRNWHTIVGGVFIEWLLKGGLGHLLPEKYKATQFFYSTTSNDENWLKWNSLSDHRKTHKMEFIALFSRADAFIAKVGSAAQSRFLLGSTGIRIWKIIGIVHALSPIEKSTDSDLQLLLKIWKFQEFPYMSGHPSWPHNPFKNRIRKIMAKLGQHMRDSGVDVDRMISTYPKLLNYEIGLSLKVLPAAASGIDLDHQKLVSQCVTDLSYKKMFEANVPAGHVAP
jgi:hypothetical protein